MSHGGIGIRKVRFRGREDHPLLLIERLGPTVGELYCVGRVCV